MEVQPLVRASVENLEDLRQDVHTAPLKGANTKCTNECRPGQTLEMNAGLDKHWLAGWLGGWLAGLLRPREAQRGPERHREAQRG